MCYVIKLHHGLLLPLDLLYVNQDSRITISTGLPTELYVYLVPQAFLLPRSRANLQCQQVDVFILGSPVPHELQQQLEQVYRFLLQLLISSLYHGLLDGLLKIIVNVYSLITELAMFQVHVRNFFRRTRSPSKAHSADSTYPSFRCSHLGPIQHVGNSDFLPEQSFAVLSKVLKGLQFAVRGSCSGTSDRGFEGRSHWGRITLCSCKALQDTKCRGK